MYLIWTQFTIIALVTGFAGYQLAYFADQIAEKTGLTRNWIGVILLATVTSLPELTSGISAVRLVGTPNLAVGDILGSCVFNLALVVVLDLMYREGSVYKRATQGHILSAALGMMLISFVGFGLTVSNKLPNFSYRHIGGFTLIIPILYAFAMRALYSFETKHAPSKITDSLQKEEKESLKRAYAFFSMAALVVIGAGIALPYVGKQIVEQMGWNSAFVGTVFISLSTSLPEIAVTISAVRLKAIELALSNVLGSNLFNVVILSVDDFFYMEGPLFHAVDPIHAVTAFSALMMTGLVCIALIQPPQLRVFNTVSAFSVLLLCVFALTGYVIFIGA